MSARALHTTFLLAALSSLSCQSGDGESAEERECAARSQAFEDFVAMHGACEGDADCTIIGSCSGASDFRAIRVDEASEGTRLMGARCVYTSDGAMYRAACSDGQCVEVMSGICGVPPPPPPRDAGMDGDTGAAADGGSDASVDAEP